MSSIQIKGINDYLLFILNDEVCEQQLLDDLKQLIRSPSFKKHNFYPRGYFNFGNREITYLLFSSLMAVLNETQSVIFSGFHQPKRQGKELLSIQKDIRNGEVLEQFEDCLFEGKINPGGKIVVFGNLYFIGVCHGEVELVGKDVQCSVANMKNASIVINGIRKENVNVNELTIFYEENGEILIKKGEM